MNENFEKLKASVDNLVTVTTTSLSDISTDVRRMRDAVLNAQVVPAAEFDALATKVDGVVEALKQATTNVDAEADGAAGQDNN